MNFGFLVRCDQRGASFSEVGASGPAASELLSVTIDNDFQAVFLGRLYYLDDLRRRARRRTSPGGRGHSRRVRAGRLRAGRRRRPELARRGLQFRFVGCPRAPVDRSPRSDGRFSPFLGARRGRGRPQQCHAASARPRAPAASRSRLSRRVPGSPLRRQLRNCIRSGARTKGSNACWLGHGWNSRRAVRRSRSAGGTGSRKWKSPRASSWQTSQPVTGNLLDAAVAQRRVGRTAAHLSGGMDSTAVALLAARQAHAASEEPVHGLALVYERLTVLSRERPYVESVDGTPGLQLHRLPGEDCLDFDAYDYDTDPDEPVLSLYQSSMCHALLKRAAEIGARTLMTGFGADELVGLQPFPLYDHLRTGRWFTAWREASALAAAAQRQLLEIPGPVRFSIFLARQSARRTRLLVARRTGRWERQQAHTIGPWVRPEFARRHGLWQRSVEHLRRQSNRCRPLALSMALEALEFGIGDAFRWEVGAPAGVHVVQPFLDPRLICFCLGFQGRVSADPQAPETDLCRRDARRAAGNHPRTTGKGSLQRSFLRRPFAQSVVAGKARRTVPGRRSGIRRQERTAAVPAQSGLGGRRLCAGVGSAQPDTFGAQMAHFAAKSGRPAGSRDPAV